MSELHGGEDPSPLETIEFGQIQPIHVAIRNLIHDYPRDEGILKELIQNADDGGASEVRFILDLSDRAEAKGPVLAWAEFGEPAILAINNAPFSSRDLERIRRLGDSGKVESPSETGKYGRGFNAVYNITDTPLLLTGDSVGFFDPCGWFVEPGKSGMGWSIDEIFLRQHSEALSLFGTTQFDPVKDRHSATAFRFPLRSRLRGQSHHDRISDERFEPTEFERLVKGLASLAEHLILFLRNIRFIGCYVSLDAQSDLETLLEITTLNEGEVVAGRRWVNDTLSVGGVGDVLDLVASSKRGSIESIFPHEFQITRPGEVSRSKWMVCTGLYAGTDNRLINQARSLNEAHNRAVPAAGAAVCVARDGELFPAVTGTVSCFLPLSKMLGGARLPFHINGAFDLDGSRTGITRTQDGQSGSTKVRAEWNRMLVADAIAPASARLIEACRRFAPSAEDLYRVFPDSAHEFPEPFTNLSSDIFETLSHLEVFGTVDSRWVKSADLRLIPDDPELHRCFVTEGLPVPVPPLPDFIRSALELVKSALQPFSSIELRSHFCDDEPGPWSIEETPFDGLRSREAVFALSRYVASFEPRIRWDGLPLALCRDGMLRRFGKCDDDPFFIADEKTFRIFSRFPQWFLDPESIIQGRLLESGCDSFREMDPGDFVDRLAFVTGESDSGPVPWNPEGAEVPNRTWLVEVFELINAFPESDSNLESSLRKAAIIPGHDGFLHRPGTAETPLLVQLAYQPLAEVLRLMSSPHWILNPQDPLTRVLTRFRERFELVWPLTQWDLVDTLHSKKALLSLDEAPWRTDAAVSRLLTFLQADINNSEFGEERLSKLRDLPLFKDAAGIFGPIDGATFFVGAFAVPEVKVPFRLLQEGGHRPLLRALGVSEITRRKLLEECVLPRLMDIEDQSLVGVMAWVRDEWNHLVQEYGSEPSLVSALEAVPCLLDTTGSRKAPFELYHPHSRRLITDLLGQEARFPHQSWYENEPHLWQRLFRHLGLATAPRPQDLVDRIEGIIARLEEGATTIESVESTLTEILEYVLEQWGALAYQSVTSTIHRECEFYEFLADTQWIVPGRIESRFFDPCSIEDRLYAPDELISATQAPRCGSVRCVFPRSLREFPTEVRGRLRVDRIPSPSDLCAHLQNVVSCYGERVVEEADLNELGKLVTGIYRGLGEHRQVASDSADLGAINTLEAICAPFSDLPCLIIPSERMFRRPRDVYRTRHPRLVPLKASFRSDESLVEAGVGLLGRRDEPTIEDLAESLVDLGTRCRPLDVVELEAVIAALRMIRTKGEERGIPRKDLEVRVPNAAGFLVDPGEVIFADDPGLEGQLPIDPHLILQQGAPFETCIYSVARLSAAMARPVGTLSDSEDSRFLEACRKLQELIQSQEFAEAICRILQHEGTASNVVHLRWLSRAQVSALKSVKCRFVIELRSGREVDLGSATVDVAYDQNLGDGGSFLVGESAMDVLYNRFADELARELDNEPKDRAPLVAILSLPEDQIHQRLDRLGIAHLRGDDFGEEDQETDLGFDSFPEDEADADDPNEPDSETEEESSGDPVEELMPAHGEEDADAPSDEDLADDPGLEEGVEDDMGEDEIDDGEHDSDERDGDGEHEDDGDGCSRQPSTSRHLPRRGDRPNGLPGVGRGTSGEAGRGTSRSRSDRDDEDSTGDGRGGGGGWTGTRGRMERGRRGEGVGPGDREQKPRSQRNAQGDLWISRPRTKQQAEESKRQNDEGDDEAPRNHSIGDSAVGWVLQYERQQGRRPTSMAHANPGYDVESRKGRVVERYIEVKGIDGEWGKNGVPLSSLQFFRSRERTDSDVSDSPPIGDRFWLYVVEHALEPEKVKIHMIQNPADKATEFRFDHGWKQAGEAADDFQPILPAVGMRIRDMDTEEVGIITRVDSNDYLMVQFEGKPSSTVIYRPIDYELINDET